MTFLEAVKALTEKDDPGRFWIRPALWAGSGLGLHLVNGETLVFMNEGQTASIPTAKMLLDRWDLVPIATITTEQRLRAESGQGRNPVQEIVDAQEGEGGG